MAGLLLEVDNVAAAGTTNPGQWVGAAGLAESQAGRCYFIDLVVYS